jgi:hypothetical protein
LTKRLVFLGSVDDLLLLSALVGSMDDLDLSMMALLVPTTLAAIVVEESRPFAAVLLLGVAPLTGFVVENEAGEAAAAEI